MQTGELITPSLKLVRHLGAGGMGTVWIAQHLGLRSNVVVKLITGEHAKNAEVVARFQREAAAAAEVRSPHVVQVFDFGVALNGQPYIAMELLEGEDLAARLARERVLDPAEVAGVVVQAARALARAHEKGIVHRDIKPENIFLCETGEDEALVKVLDFGIAKIAGAGSFGGTATGAFLGTPYFMSPEQVNDAKSIDHRTDLWSLGVVAYLALTGSRPFDGETLVAVAMKICTAAVPAPSELNPGLSGALDAWFARACAKAPGERFQTARAMSDALVSAVGGHRPAHVPARASALARADTEAVRAYSGESPSRAGAIAASTAPTELGAMPAPAAAGPFFATTNGASTAEAPAAPSRAHVTAETARLSRRPLMLGVVGVVLLAVVATGVASLANSSVRGPQPASVTSTSEPQTTAARASPSAAPLAATVLSPSIVAPSKPPLASDSPSGSASAVTAAGLATTTASNKRPVTAPAPSKAAAASTSAVRSPTVTPPPSAPDVYKE